MQNEQNQVSEITPGFFWRTFSSTLLGVILLYFPALPLASEFVKNLPLENKLLVLPETGFITSLALYCGAVVAITALTRKNKTVRLRSWLSFSAIWSGGGAILECLLLPVLARGWEGFLLWADPALWLMTFVLFGLALITGFIWGLLTGIVIFRQNLLFFSKRKAPESG